MKTTEAVCWKSIGVFIILAMLGFVLIKPVAAQSGQPILGSSATNGIYVWTDGISPISTDQDRRNLVSVLTDPSQPLGIVLLDNYNLGGYLDMWPAADLHAFNTLAHDAGLVVYALYTDKNWIAEVIQYNTDCTDPSQRFDGYAMDYETFGGGEPSTAADIQYYADAKAALGALPLHVSIGWHWDNNISTSCVDFTGYPDNTKLGNPFSLNGYQFAGLEAEPFVNASGGVIGLQFTDAGVEIDLPGPTLTVTLDAASFTTLPLTLNAFDSSGVDIANASVPGDNTVHSVTLSGNNIVKIIITGGGWEGILVRICSTKPAYQQILDLVNSVDVQTAFETSAEIERRAMDVVSYVAQLNKPAFLTLETQDLSGKTDMSELNTFYEEGEAAMWSQLANVNFGTATQPGAMVHYYRHAYNSGIVGWPVHPGSNVVVQPIDATTGGISPVTVTYDQVTGAGTTSVAISSTGRTPPAGFQLGDPPTYYELTTTTSLAGSIEVCIKYSGTSFDDEAQLKLYHFEDTDGDGNPDTWVNRTVTLDTTGKIICARVNSLSPFAIFEPMRNQPPSVNAGGPYTVNEGDSVVVTASGSDPDSDALSYAWDLDGDGAFETSGQSVPFSAARLDGPSSRTITVKATDSGGLSASDQAPVGVQNVRPTVGPISAPVDPVSVNTAISTSANFTDPGVLDTHTALWDWGDGSTTPGAVSETNGSGSVSASHGYAAAGLYTLKLTVTDKDGDSGQSIFHYVVYDPNGGFVTGGGWINSPAGAYMAKPSLTGKPNFGFVTRYQKGATVPTGQTEFQFQVAKLNFRSTSYQWLVVSGPKAQIKGSGAINGAGDYGFMLTVSAGKINGGSGDKFRIKIVDRATGNIVYDNQMGADDTADPTTIIRGRSIVIHKE